MWRYKQGMTKPTQDKPSRGGARTGAGRKAKDGAKPTVKVIIPVEESQRAKLRRLGGAVWVRSKIDEAEEPKDQT